VTGAASGPPAAAAATSGPAGAESVQQLPRPVRDRVAGTFSTEPGLVPLTEIRESAGAIAARYEQERDQQLVSGRLGKVAMGGLATVGLDGCLWAGTVGAIQTLLVRDGPAAPGVVCDRVPRKSIFSMPVLRMVP
jgi:hypothetical protein